MANRAVELREAEGVAWLTLNRPECLNALSLALVREYRFHLEKLRHRFDIKVIVTTGAGRSFCAGSDLRELAGLDGSRSVAEAEHLKSDVFSMLGDMPQPTIALLHGHVLGGGLGLALYHDFRVAAFDAVVGFPELDFGWLPPWGIDRLVELVGLSKAKWLTMTAATISGAEAKEAGLVNLSVLSAELIETGKKLAIGLARKPGNALARTKALFRESSAQNATSFDRRAHEIFKECFEAPEAQERLSKFIKRKRKP